MIIENKLIKMMTWRQNKTKWQNGKAKRRKAKSISTF
jgi:hypothetical protein